MSLNSNWFKNGQPSKLEERKKSPPKYEVGWSIVASTLESPRPRPRSSRVFEAEGWLFFKFRGLIKAEGWLFSIFRGLIEAEDSLKLRGIFKGNPRRHPKVRGEVNGTIFEVFDHPSAYYLCF